MNKEEIWAELDAAYLLPEREPDDIDSEQISKRHKITLDSARRRMRKMAETGKYVYLTVRDNSIQSGRRNVLRRIKP